MRTILILFGFCISFPAAGLAQSAEPSPSPSPAPTPFPRQEGPPPVHHGVPPGFDDAIALPPGTTPTPIATPDPFANAMPADHDEFLAGTGEHGDSDWDPTKPFPGNYYALPLTLDVGWRPCLDCDGNVYERPGEVSLWVGYAFQPFARVSSPYMAIGLDWVVAAVDERGTVRGRSRIAPTARWGWNFSAASVYATSGIILPGEDRKRAGYHLGVGASSFAFLAVAACAAEAIPSVVEVGVDVLEDPEVGREHSAWTLKFGWGF